LLPRVLFLLLAFGAQAAPPASPYLDQAVEVGVPHWFQQVTFKDVGLASDRAERATWIRAVTRALASSLDARLMAHAHPAPEAADPRWHHACRGRHVYVDVWRSTSPDRVGFSLWRGCGADDQFAWQEVPTSLGLISSAQQVAGAIADVLSVCDERTC
jgi:hypothetical protein